MPAKQQRNGGWKPSTLAEAKKNALIRLQTTSGTRWIVRALTLDELVAHGGLPDDLLKVATAEYRPGGAVGLVAEHGDQGRFEEATTITQGMVGLRDRIVLAAVVEPKLKLEDLAELDPYDRVEIAAVAQRRLAVDEDGRLVDPLARFLPARDVT